MDNELDIIIRFLIDQAAQGHSLRAIESLERQFKEFEDQIKAVKAQARELREISNRLASDFRGLFIGGAAIAGGIFAIANKYVKDAKEATEVTEQWKEAQEDLAKSGNRIGAVFAEEALPLLLKATELAGKAASFIESHPEIVRAALNVGLITAGIGAIGVAVSKGIRLYADIAYLVAVAQEQAGIKQFERAVDKFLLGTAQFSKAGGVQAVAGKTTGKLAALGLLTEAGGATALGASLAAALGVALGASINDLITKITGKGAYTNQFLTVGANNLGQNVLSPVAQRVSGISPEEAERKTLVFTALIGKLTGAIDENSPLWIKAAAAVKKSGDDLKNAEDSLEGVQASEQFEKLLSAYERYKADDLQLVQDHYRERAQIIGESLQQEEQATRRMNDGIARVRSQAGGAIRQATQQFNEENRRAEVEYANQRAQIVRDGGIEIQRIEQGLQERLRKLALDHGERMDDLSRSRDALGLVKEQRRYNQERSEETRAANLEIRQRRQDLAVRLQELQQSFEQERAQRLTEFQARLQEIRTNAAAQIAELRTQHQAELREIREQRVARIRELDQQFLDERKRRTQQFLQQVRDLDASLLGEQNLKKSYQAKMIADLDKFLAAYRQKIGSLANSRPAGKWMGGYAAYGTYTLGDSPGGGRGKSEYVMTGSTTEAAERLLGGQLTQEKILSAMGMYAGARNAFNYQDNRRIDGRLGPTDRQMIVTETVRAVERMFSDALPRARGA